VLQVEYVHCTVYPEDISLSSNGGRREDKLKVHLHEIFLFWFFALEKHIHIGQIIMLLSVFNFFLNSSTYSNFLTVSGD
jgi:hypothetical protein